MHKVVMGWWWWWWNVWGGAGDHFNVYLSTFKYNMQIINIFRKH